MTGDSRKIYRRLLHVVLEVRIPVTNSVTGEDCKGAFLGKACLKIYHYTVCELQA